MTVYMQFTDGDGVLHEVAVPAYCEGATLAARLDYGVKVLRVETPASGVAQITMPDDYRGDWEITGYRSE